VQDAALAAVPSLRGICEANNRSSSVTVFFAGYSSWKIAGLISQRARVRVALPQPRLYLLRSSSGEDTGLSTQVRGFDSRTKHHYFRGLVQLKEHRTLTANVAGSSPASSANFFGALTHWLSTCLSSRMKSVRFRYASPTVLCAPLAQSARTLVP
jgi:hypothetical protein